MKPRRRRCTVARARRRLPRRTPALTCSVVSATWTSTCRSDSTRCTSDSRSKRRRRPSAPPRSSRSRGVAPARRHTRKRVTTESCRRRCNDDVPAPLLRRRRKRPSGFQAHRSSSWRRCGFKASTAVRACAEGTSCANHPPRPRPPPPLNRSSFEFHHRHHFPLWLLPPALLLSLRLAMSLPRRRWRRCRARVKSACHCFAPPFSRLRRSSSWRRARSSATTERCRRCDGRRRPRSNYRRRPQHALRSRTS